MLAQKSGSVVRISHKFGDRRLVLSPAGDGIHDGRHTTAKAGYDFFEVLLAPEAFKDSTVLL